MIQSNITCISKGPIKILTKILITGMKFNHDMCSTGQTFTLRLFTRNLMIFIDFFLFCKAYNIFSYKRTIFISFQLEYVKPFPKILVKLPNIIFFERCAKNS